MKKWYQWFYLSIVFAIGGVINYYDGRQMIAAIVQVSITVVFGFLQLLCDLFFILCFACKDLSERISNNKDNCCQL